MYHEFFSGRGLLILPIVAMLAFLFTFVAAVLHTFRGARRDTYAELAGMPLSDEEVPTRSEPTQSAIDRRAR